MSSSGTIPRHVRTWQSRLFFSQSDRPAPLHPIFVNSLIVVLCAGLLAIWILICTDWWARASAIVGSAVTVCGTVWGVALRLRAGRIKALPRWARRQLAYPTPGFHRLVKALNGLSTALSVAFVLVLSATFFVGSLVVERNSVFQADLPQGAQMFTAGNGGQPEGLEFNKRHVIWASWLRRKRVTVRVTGYPDRSTVIRPWRSAKLTAPNSFVDRPVMLVMVNRRFICHTGDACRLMVEIKSGNSLISTQVNVSDLRANPFWIGCEGYVKVPANLAQQLGSDLNDPNPQCGASSEVQVGDSVRVTLRSPSSIIGCGQLSADKAGIADDSHEVLFVEPVDSGGEC